MEITLIKYPTYEDWMLVKRCALVTAGMKPVTAPNHEWKEDILRARHSPIRELKYVFLIEDIPYWVSTHLARHHEGAQPYVRSQRNDRQSEYDRGSAPQDAPVTMILSLNAEGFITMANKRLCHKAADETRSVVEEMCRIARKLTPEIADQLEPMCMRNGGVCKEMKPCGKMPWCGGGV